MIRSQLNKLHHKQALYSFKMNNEHHINE